jgi:hypothetical protein
LSGRVMLSRRIASSSSDQLGFCPTR